MKRFKRYSNEAFVLLLVVQWMLLIPKIFFDYSLLVHMLLEVLVTGIYFLWLLFPEIKNKLITFSRTYL